MPVDFTRRRFLATSAGTSLAAAILPSRAAGHVPAQRPVLGARLAGDPDPHDLAARAVDAARAVGATYADARLTDTRSEMYYNGRSLNSDQELGIGVRVLVDGFWGFQSSPLWTADEAARLAREAVAQAKASGGGKARRVELGPPPPVVKGEWIMPVKIDPFTVPLGEKIDYMNYALAHAGNFMVDGGAQGIFFQLSRQRKTFASSDDSAWSQTTYSSRGDLQLSYRDDFVQRLHPGAASYDVWSLTGKGWELFAESSLTDDLPRLLDEAEQARHSVPVEVDRYDAVFSASAMASLLDGTLGAATELDRALGYEANASGTSYLNEPLDMAGSLVIGNPAINIVGNRSLPGGVATVKWDDESVAPQDFAIVKNGVLADFQTTREQASWMDPYYRKTNHPLVSHGCAGAESALSLTMQRMPNIQLLPAAADTSFDALVAGVKKGVAVMSMYVNMDQQQLNGLGYAQVRKIVNGKLGPYIEGAGVQFRAPEIWKNVAALGGARETRWFGYEQYKGQPSQNTAHSVGAVPARINNVDIIDVQHRA